jgi:hypothetical protein
MKKQAMSYIKDKLGHQIINKKPSEKLMVFYEQKKVKAGN